MLLFQSSSPKTSLPSPSSSSPEPGTNTCSYCGLVCASIRALIIHLRSHNKSGKRWCKESIASWVGAWIVVALTWWNSVPIDDFNHSAFLILDVLPFLSSLRRGINADRKSCATSILILSQWSKAKCSWQNAFTDAGKPAGVTFQS